MSAQYKGGVNRHAGSLDTAIFGTLLITVWLLVTFAPILLFVFLGRVAG